MLNGLALSAVSETSQHKSRKIYKMGEVLGRGGQAVVLSAEDIRARRQVAMKVITDARSHLKDEIGILETMRHPNIMPVFDHGRILPQTLYIERSSLSIDEREYMAMMRANSGTVSSLEQHHRELLPISQIVSIADQVMAGVDFAHGEGVLHNDIKKANVLLHRHGTTTDQRYVRDTYLTAVVTDFGVARVNRDHGTLTRAENVRGTHTHVSPERAFGEDSVRGDVYATGVMLYELLTGSLPYDNEDMYGKWLDDVLARKVRVRNPNTISGLPMTLDRKAVLSVAIKAVSLDPRDRYQNMQTMRTSLHAEYRAAVRRQYGEDPLYVSRSAVQPKDQTENTFEVMIPLYRNEPSELSKHVIDPDRQRARHRRATTGSIDQPGRPLQRSLPVDTAEEQPVIRERMPGEKPSPRPRRAEIANGQPQGRHRYISTG